MLTGNCRHESDTHTYYIGDWVVPGTSEITKVSGDMNDAWFTPEGRDRGTAIHQLTEWADLGMLDLDDVDGEYRPWLLAYKSFLNDVSPTYDLVEQCAYNRELGFATTIDRVGILHGPFVLNIKTGAYHPAHDLVSAGEVLSLWGWRAPVERLTLYLKKNGRYKLQRHDNNADYDSFLNALATWRKECHQPRKHGPLSKVRRLSSRSFLSSARPSRALNPGPNYSRASRQSRTATEQCSRSSSQPKPTTPLSKPGKQARPSRRRSQSA